MERYSVMIDALFGAGGSLVKSSVTNRFTRFWVTGNIICEHQLVLLLPLHVSACIPNVLP